MTDACDDLGFAKVDLSRSARCGRPEVIFCEGKTPAELAPIAVRLAEATGYVLGTRARAASNTTPSSLGCPRQFTTSARAASRSAPRRRAALPTRWASSRRERLISPSPRKRR